MKKIFVYLSISFFGLSCNPTPQLKPNRMSATKPDTTENKQNNRVAFDFNAKRMNSYDGLIEVTAFLLNKGIDTAYFLTSTCDGDQYSLRYDTTKFVSNAFLNCNASFPLLQKIAPGGHHNFKAHFKCSNTETGIKLGFDFYEVDKSLDITGTSLIDIHNRQSKKQNVLWAAEKAIR